MDKDNNSQTAARQHRVGRGSVAIALTGFGAAVGIMHASKTLLASVQFHQPAAGAIRGQNATDPGASGQNVGKLATVHTYRPATPAGRHSLEGAISQRAGWPAWTVETARALPVDARGPAPVLSRDSAAIEPASPLRVERPTAALASLAVPRQSEVDRAFAPGVLVLDTPEAGATTVIQLRELTGKTAVGNGERADSSSALAQSSAAVAIASGLDSGGSVVDPGDCSASSVRFAIDKARGIDDDALVLASAQPLNVVGGTLHADALNEQEGTAALGGLAAEEQDASWKALPSVHGRNVREAASEFALSARRERLTPTGFTSGEAVAPAIMARPAAHQPGTGDAARAAALGGPAEEERDASREALSSVHGRNVREAASEFAPSARRERPTPTGFASRETVAPAIVARPAARQPGTGDAASTAAVGAGTASQPATQRRVRLTAAGVLLNVSASVKGHAAGSLSLLIRDRHDISVRLGDVLQFVQPMMNPEQFERLAASRASATLLTLNDLREAGIPVSFNEKDELVFGRR